MSSEDDFVKSINYMAASIQGYKESILRYLQGLVIDPNSKARC
jgi:hypothetical protein